jgi:hypothetical protein
VERGHLGRRGEAVGAGRMPAVRGGAERVVVIESVEGGMVMATEMNGGTESAWLEQAREQATEAALAA